MTRTVTATPLTAELVVGAAELERTARGLRPHRLPRRIRDRFADPQLTLMEAQPSGVRIAISTAARRLTLELTPPEWPTKAWSARTGAVDVLVDGVVLHSQVLARGDAIELDRRRRRHPHAGQARPRDDRRPRRRREDDRDLVAPQRAGRPGRPAHGRPGPPGATYGTGVAPSRQQRPSAAARTPPARPASGRRSLLAERTPSCTTSASAAARWSTRSWPGSCATPRQISSAPSSASTSSTTTRCGCAASSQRSTASSTPSATATPRHRSY